jgi:aldehyde dehydrogenase
LATNQRRQATQRGSHAAPSHRDPEFPRGVKARYENFIGGKWVAPVDGGYFENISPVTGKPVREIVRSQAAGIELALDTAHKAKDAWGNIASAKRAEILNKIAGRMEENLKVLASVKTI